MKNKFKAKLASMVSVVLVLAMMTGMGGVFAQDILYQSSDGYETVAVIEEDLGNGVVLTKELSVKKSSVRVGFADARYASVTHTLRKEGNIVSQIMASAQFISELGQNVCYVVDESYTILKEGDNPAFYQYTDISEKAQSNLGSNPKYAQYTVKYRNTGPMPFNSSMWVKCTANGSTSSSPSSYSLGENQVLIDDMIISFG